MIDGVVAERGNHLAGLDTLQRVWTANSLEVDVLKILLRRCRQRCDVRRIVTIRQAKPRKTQLLHRIADVSREAVSVRYVVEKVVLPQLIEQRDQVAAREQRYFTALVVIEAAGVNRKPGLHRFIEQVWFGESERNVSDPVSHLGIEAQRFAQAQEVIR